MNINGKEIATTSKMTEPMTIPAIAAVDRLVDEGEVVAVDGVVAVVSALIHLYVGYKSQSSGIELRSWEQDTDGYL